MLKFIKSNWFIISSVTILTLICIWLIKIDYFSYSVNLTNILPSNTQLSINLNMSELNTTINQKSKLTKDNIINNISQTIIEDVKNTISKYNINWSDNIINLIEPEIIYYITDTKNDWGLLAKANNKKILAALQKSNDLTIATSFNNSNIYKLTTKDESTIFFSFINNTIIAISSNQNTIKDNINNYANKVDMSWQQRFTIINLEPILKIKINPKLKSDSFHNPLLAEFYKIIQPILLSSATELQINFDQTGNYLLWQISNIEANNYTASYNKIDISNYLSYVNFQPSMLIGLNSPANTITQNIVKSTLFKSITNLSKVITGTDILNNLINQINKSIFIAVNNSSTFLIVINKEDLEIISSTIYEILGKQTPRSIQKTLPDGTNYNELVTDEASIKKRLSSYKNVAITTIFAPNANTTFNYYNDGDKVIISTDYDLLTQNIANNESYENQCIINTPFAGLLYIETLSNDGELKPYKIDEFTVYDQSYDKNIVIRGCLKLK